MNKIVKTMPLMALLLGAGIFTVDAAFKANNMQTNQEWVLTGANPGQPSSYTQAPMGTREDCQDQDENVCVVIAPASASNPSVPQFSTALQTALNGDLDHENIIKGPFVE